MARTDIVRLACQGGARELTSATLIASFVSSIVASSAEVVSNFVDDPEALSARDLVIGLMCVLRWYTVVYCGMLATV